MSAHLYLVALGSNQRIAHIGAPAAVIEQAIAALEMPEIDVFAVSPIIGSRPLARHSGNMPMPQHCCRASLIRPRCCGHCKALSTISGANDPANHGEDGRLISISFFGRAAYGVRPRRRCRSRMCRPASATLSSRPHWQLPPIGTIR